MTLPQFLLSWADSRWTWLGLKGIATPVANARWSLLRTLTITAVVAGAGACFGLAVVLALMHQPVGWLPWLLGLWSGANSLCWYGLTGLCWNQRAARLRADPALFVGLQKVRYPVFRACLGFVYFVLLGVITPLALVVTFENVRGEITWNRTRARLIAAGEQLTIREILGPEIPPDRNAGAAPVFAPFFDYAHKSPTVIGGDEEGRLIYDTSLVWPQSNALARIELARKTPEDYLPKTASGSRSNPKTPWIDLADWEAAYRSAREKPKRGDKEWIKGLSLPEGGTPAQVVLAGLAPADSLLVEISAAAALPRAQFPLHYDEGMETVLRHLGMIKGVQRTLQIRCAARLATGNADGAFADATNALNIAELFREEPLLISQLVRYAQMHAAVHGLWQGLAEHRWSDAHLAAFQSRLGQIDYLPGLVLAFEGERACGIFWMDQGVNIPQVFADQMDLGGVVRIAPRSLFRQNESIIATAYTQMIIGMRESVGSPNGLLPLMELSKTDWAETLPYSPYTVMARMLFPAVAKAGQKTANAQTLVELTIAACALERYHLAHGQFPGSLDQLAPKYIPEVPRDPMVNRPFHYQRTDDGWFQLYSVGPNGTDDAGVIRKSNLDKQDLDWSWPVPTRPSHPRLF